MDLRLYYQKIRDAKATIPDAFPVMVSHKTDDGGKEGSVTEVTPGIAAKMLVEGIARLATSDEAKAFRETQAEIKRWSDQAAEAAKVHLTIVPTSELHKLKTSQKHTKDQA